MRYLISYDIPSTPQGDRRRARIARALENVGLRIQFSLFELDVATGAIEAVIDRLEEILDPETDSVRVYPLCGACVDKSQSLGVHAV